MELAKEMASVGQPSFNIGVEGGRVCLATASTGQPEPTALVLNEPDCYHFRVLDPRLPL